MTDQWLGRFKQELNYDLDDRDAQFEGFLSAGLSVALAYVGADEGSEFNEYLMGCEAFRQAVFVYARNLFDTGGQSDKGVPPAFYNLLNILKR